MLSVRDGELIRQPQEFLDPAISQLIPDAAAFIPSPYVSAPTQACELGTRFMLMAGKPYGETPIYNGPYVD